jgi:membrane protein implicated in regulation of membrane protease activity
MLSFRSVTAALTFFGLAGLAAQSANASVVIVLLVAVAAGLAALYSVYRLMRWLSTLSSDGTVRVQRAIGHQGTVYLRIPGHNAGTGKIQIVLQSRTVELLATTGGDPLPAGARVLVVDVLTPNTVAVAPALEPEQIKPERTEHV